MNRVYKKVIVQRDGGWYWWDETWSSQVGPFNTKEECQQDLDRYCEETFDEDGNYKRVVE